MKKFLQDHVGKILITTILSIIVWVINLFTNQYNPYTNFLSLYYPNRYLEKDIFISIKEYQWSGSSDSGPQNYTFFGYLKNNNSSGRYDITWHNDNEVPWGIFSDTIINKKNYKYTPVYKSRLHDYAIYPVNDPSYMRNELISDFLLVIFFSIPIITVPFFIYLFYLGYLERKNEKKN